MQKIYPRTVSYVLHHLLCRKTADTLLEVHPISRSKVKVIQGTQFLKTRLWSTNFCFCSFRTGTGGGRLVNPIPNKIGLIQLYIFSVPDPKKN